MSLQASSLTIFHLGDDPNQVYSFQPIGSHSSVTLNVGPYSGSLEQNGTTVDGYFFCISYTKTANWDTSYTGSVVDPSTPKELEAAFLDSQLLSLGGASASLGNYLGPISMAIWQIMNPGSVPLDPAAQPFVSLAQNAYTSGQLNADMFSNTSIFVPNNPNIQSFMLLTGGGLHSSPAVPEPGPLVMMGCGMLLIGIVRRRRA
jgi:hypothetical protein